MLVEWVICDVPWNRGHVTEGLGLECSDGLYSGRLLQICEPQVRMGLKRDLYTVSFEFIESLDLNIGRSVCSRLSSNLRLDLRCGPRVDVSSMIMIPGYLTGGVVGIPTPCS